jgi:uncharacterized protein involved in type VI secretion and phage assembly/uncharacterized Zn-binding protein involved in type VI secretion
LGDYSYQLDFTRCQKKYKPIDYIVQYEQSDYAFLQVLCADHGLYYYADVYVDDMAPTRPQLNLNFGDHYQYYKTVAHRKQLTWSEQFNQSAETFYTHNLVRPVNYTTQEVYAGSDVDVIPAYHWQATSTVKPNMFSGVDYNPIDADADLHETFQADNNAGQDFGPVAVFPLGVQHYDDHSTKIKLVANMDAQLAQQWSYKTKHVPLCLGTVVSLTQGNVDETGLPDTLLPIAITHEARDYSVMTGRAQDNISIISAPLDADYTHYYENKVTAIMFNHAIYVPKLDPMFRAEMPSLLSGVVVTSDQSIMSEEGGMAITSTDVNPVIEKDQYWRVRVLMPWDSNNLYQEAAKCPWVRVINRQVGSMHLPHVGEEVLLAPVDNRPNRFVIVGSAYNSLNPPPFNIGKNPALAGIKTIGKTMDNPHYFYSNHTIDHEHIVLKTMGDYYEIAGNTDDKEQCEYIKKVAESLYHCAHGDMEVEVKDGSLTIKAKEAIIFDVGDTNIKIVPEGIYLKGSDIILETLLGTNAPLATLTNNHSCPKHNSNDSPHVGGPVCSGSTNVHIDDLPAARVGDAVKCQGPMDVITTGNYGVWINGQPAARLGSATAHGGKVTSGSMDVFGAHNLNLGLSFKKKDAYQDIQVSFKLMGIQTGGSLISHGMFNVDAKEPDQMVKSYPDMPTDNLTGITRAETVKGGDYYLRLSREDREYLIYSLNGQPQFPYYRAPIHIPTQNNPDDVTIIKGRQFESKVLWPLITLNCRKQGHGYEEAKNSGATDVIDPIDIQYFQNNGNNVTIFIHGYNVPLGQLGDEFSGVKTVEDATSEQDRIDAMLAGDKDPGVKYDQILVAAPYKSNIWRDQNIVSHQLGVKIDPNIFQDANDQETQLNGTGAMNWFVNMEKNLNQASGADFDDPESYEKYERMLHVTWSGDWGAANYQESVAQAFSLVEATRLAETIALLKNKGLEVNLIAHSLGNAFLLETLRVLATTTKFKGVVVDHTFMWDAAVPNNVFNRPKPKKHQYDRWDFKQALNATQKVTVLHSYNDNILGPFPNAQQQQADLHQVYKAKPLAEWFCAYLCDMFNVQSLYNIAMAIGLETHLILHAEVQELCYQNILQFHSELISQATDPEEQKRDFEQGKYMPDLQQQMHMVEKTGHYQSLIKQMDDGIKKMRADWDNQNSHLNIFFNAGHENIKALLDDLLHIKHDVDDMEEMCDAAKVAFTIAAIFMILFGGEILAVGLVGEVGSVASEVAVEADATSAAVNAGSDAIDTAADDDATEDATADDDEEEGGSKLCGKDDVDEINDINSDENIEKYADQDARLKKLEDKEKDLLKDEAKDDMKDAAEDQGKDALKSLLDEVGRYFHIYGAAYLVHMLTDKRINAWHVPAMGYQRLEGLPKYVAKKVKYVDQTKWLYQHSGMKIPSKDLMNHVYKLEIFDKMNGFGEYPK